MIISCPQCDTSYNIPDGSVSPKGRKVRCSACSHRWNVLPPNAQEQVIEESFHDEPLASSEQASAAEETAEGLDRNDFDGGASRHDYTPTEPAPSSIRARTSLRTVGLWLALLVVVISLASFVLARRQIAAAFPGAAEIYATLGIGVDEPLTLALEHVWSEEFIEEGQAVIVINGVIVNVGERPQAVPVIRVNLLDSERGDLASTDVSAIENHLKAGDKTTFEARFPEPPEQATQFSVSFTLEGDENEVGSLEQATTAH